MDLNPAQLRQRWHKAKPTKAMTFWVIVGTIVLTIYVGFSLGGWVTDGKANQMAVISAQDAVVARLAPICVTQFSQDPQNGEKLAEIKELSSTVQRATYIKGEGWATMPGELDPDEKVATECAHQLMDLGE